MSCHYPSTRSRAVNPSIGLFSAPALKAVFPCALAGGAA